MRRKKAALIFCGTSNVELPVPNKTFYPEAFAGASRLRYYASLFNTVEVNSSFYKIPMAKTVARWGADVPEDFRFTFKMWRGVTHEKLLQYSKDDIDKFVAVINEVGARKGCLLLQFPASVHADQHNKFRALSRALKGARQAGWQVAFEFRHTSWYTPKTYNIISKEGDTIVRHDMPKSASLDLDDTSFNASYFRFHGEAGKYRGTYATQELKDIAEAISKKHPSYLYFNNTLGAAVHNAIMMQHLTEQQLA